MPHKHNFFFKNQSLVHLIFIKRRIPSWFETEADKSTFLVAASPRRGDIGSSKCGKCWLLIPAEGLCTLVNTFTHSQQYFRNRLDKHNWKTVFLFSNDPSCKDGNARYETASLKFCLIKYELNIHVVVPLNCLSHLRLNCKIGFRISCFNEAVEKLSELNTFRVRKNRGISNIFDQIKVSEVPLWIGHCHLCMEGSLKLRLLYNINVITAMINDGLP